MTPCLGDDDFRRQVFSPPTRPQPESVAFDCDVDHVDISTHSVYSQLPDDHDRTEDTPKRDVLCRVFRTEIVISHFNVFSWQNTF